MQGLSDHIKIDFNLETRPQTVSPSAFDKVHYHFSNGDPIFINNINRKANEIGESHKLKDRPIIILHFNPNRDSIFVTDPEYSLQTIRVRRDENYYKLRTKNEKGVYLYVYIFDHNISHKNLTINVLGESKPTTDKTPKQPVCEKSLEDKKQIQKLLDEKDNEDLKIRTLKSEKA